MVFVTILILIMLSIAFTVLMIYGFRKRGPWRGGWTIFVIVLLAMWAASLWILPTGPVLFEVYWIPILLVGLVITVLLAAATPMDSKKYYTKSIADEEESASSKYSASVFFWIFVVILAAIIVFGYWQ